MSEGRLKAGNPTLSWLVRCWEEPRERSQDGPILRGFVRDLKTGEERYVSDPRELGELLSRGDAGSGGGRGGRAGKTQDRRLTIS